MLTNLIELALQRIEAQASLVLSRQIGTPNIAAKGKLEPRRVWVPTWLAAGKHSSGDDEMEDRGVKGKGKGKTLIEVVESSGDQDKKKQDGSTSTALPKLKGILKHSGSKTSNRADVEASSVTTATSGKQPKSVSLKPQRPAWSWEKASDERLRITINVPKEVKFHYCRKTLFC